MEILKSMIDRLLPLWPTGVALVAILLVLYAVRFLLDRRYRGVQEQPFRRQIFTLVLSLIGLIVVIIVLPVDQTLRGQLLSLVGILLSATIALSSTTFVGNVMAGLMLRVVRAFRPGDFIRIGDHFGRVSEQSLLHVEIQTEDSDLATMPNLYLVTHPYKVVRSSGTIVSAEVSLGYDVPHEEVEHLLLEAAGNTELQEPFLQVIELGDFSVTYRVAGLLTDVKHLISVRSRLRRMMLDSLHRGGVEIVSPTFMNTRSLREDRRFIPAQPDRRQTPPKPQPTKAPEQVVFDKAEEAASLEKLKELSEKAKSEIDSLKEKLQQSTDDATRQGIQVDIERIEARGKRLAELIEAREQEKKS